MWNFPDTIPSKSELKLIYYSIPVCTHSNKIYIWVCSIVYVICHFWTNIVNDHESWLLVFKKIMLGWVFSLLCQTGELFLARGKKEAGPFYRKVAKESSSSLISIQYMAFTLLWMSHEKSPEVYRYGGWNFALHSVSKTSLHLPAQWRNEIRYK